MRNRQVEIGAVLAPRKQQTTTRHPRRQSARRRPAEQQHQLSISSPFEAPLPARANAGKIDPVDIRRRIDAGLGRHQHLAFHDRRQRGTQTPGSPRRDFTQSLPARSRRTRVRQSRAGARKRGATGDIGARDRQARRSIPDSVRYAHDRGIERRGDRALSRRPLDHRLRTRFYLCQSAVRAPRSASNWQVDSEAAFPFGGIRCEQLTSSVFTRLGLRPAVCDPPLG